MTITATWDDDTHTLVRVIWTRRTSWDDWDQYQAQVVEMVTSVEHMVNFVHELHADLLLPNDWVRGFIDHAQAGGKVRLNIGACAELNSGNANGLGIFHPLLLHMLL